MPGRCEPQGKHYFPTLLKPTDYNVEGCLHGNIDVKDFPVASCEQYLENLCHLMSSPNETQYCTRCLETGISKLSLFSGLDSWFTLRLPKLAGPDIMHLAALNLSDLMISLWHGTMDCTCPDDKANWPWFVLQGDVWQKHGKAVTDTLYYLSLLKKGSHWSV